ncbi:MAG: HAD hydrolase-like protein, partial [Anaerolineales bacterium]|nr:HAD hydrolase-like protein [Anaerolineales bacterium]
MIESMIFDLDGTLVQTEKLKALSYAQAVLELCPDEIQEDEVISAFKEVVGLTRKEVATFLMDKFHLQDTSKRRMEKFGVNTPWQAFVQVRLSYYQD